MKNRRIYIIILLLVGVAALTVALAANNSIREKTVAQKMLGTSVKTYEIPADDPFIKQSFPGLEKMYAGGGNYAVITRCVGYKGPIRVMTAIDSATAKTKSIRIISEVETPEYAEHIKADWFLTRLADKSLTDYLNLVVLDPETNRDIVQVTGATVSSQAIVNAVNTAIGAWQYIVRRQELAPVADVVPQEMWLQDENSFAINAGDQSIRIDTDELTKYATVTTDTILQKTTGTKNKIKVEGPLLTEVMKKHGLKLENYQGLGLTGRDGYYALLSQDILSSRQIILGYRINDQPVLTEEKPVRVAVPDEMGVYWVKMLASVDLYPDIPEKDIKALHMFDVLVRDIEPYYYEYYGSKDKSYEIGKILNKFTALNLQGFFTMVSTDGLTKNETMAMVRERYYLKVEGDNAPMNIAPNFKLGMNVKTIAYFSTTDDVVIFPAMFTQVLAGENTAEGIKLELAEILAAVGMNLENEPNLVVVDAAGTEYGLAQADFDQTSIYITNASVKLVAPNYTCADLMTVRKNDY